MVHENIKHPQSEGCSTPEDEPGQIDIDASFPSLVVIIWDPSKLQMNTIDCSPKVVAVSTSYLCLEVLVELLKRFGIGLQRARKCRRLTQEDFFVVSSRTYLSSLERGIKAPTITKIDEISTVLGVHRLSLIAYAYLPSDSTEREQFWAQIVSEVDSFDCGTDAFPADERR